MMVPERIEMQHAAAVDNPDAVSVHRALTDSKPSYIWSGLSVCTAGRLLLLKVPCWIHGALH